MRQRVTAVFVAAAFMVFAGVVGAAAQQHRNSFDDWLGFDQSDDRQDQPARERTSAGDLETQPDRGFPTLAKENIETTKAAIKQYAELVAQGGWPQLPQLELRTGVNLSGGCTAPPPVAGHRRPPGLWRLSRGLRLLCGTGRETGAGAPRRSANGFPRFVTIDALNVPASARLRQLRTNLTRLQTSFRPRLPGSTCS